MRGCGGGSLWKACLLLLAGGLLVLLPLPGCGAVSPTPGVADQAGVVQGGIPPTDQQRAEPGDATVDLATLVAGNNGFGLDLFRAVRTEDANLVCSPYSLSAVLAMTFAGATGETEREMAKVLRFTLPQARLHPAFNALDAQLSAGGQLRVANALWGMAGYAYSKTFLDLLAADYGAGLGLVDFNQPEAARTVVNTWAADKTNGRIRELIPPGGIAKDSAWLMLTDAVYFKADWLDPFSEQNTHHGSFYLVDGSQVMVPMMGRAGPLAAADETDYQAVELPYAGGRFSMVVILPGKDGLETFVAGLDEARLADVLAGLKPRPVRLSMPRFSFFSDPQVKDALMVLGIKKMFETGSDFSPMIDLTSGKALPDGLGVGGVHQKAFVAVGEKGTEAAAVSSVTVAAGAVTTTEEFLELVLDRPFLFFIRDVASGQVVFVGQVMDPSAGAAEG